MYYGENNDNKSYSRMMKEKDIITNGELSSKIKGDYGELRLSSVLKSLPNGYHVIDNIMLRTKKGTTQIDHILVSNAGILVIETKNYKGRIYGDIRGRVWTQTLYNGAHNKFYSPVKQNEGHIRNLIRSIRVPSGIVGGVIVFTDETADLRFVKCEFCHTPETLYSYIMRNRTAVLTDGQVLNIIRRIDKVNIDTYENRLIHKEYVKRTRGDIGR